MKYHLLLVFFLISASTVLRAQTGNPIARAAQAFRAKDYARAVDLLQKAYKTDQNPAFLFNIGRSYEEWGKYGSAAKYYKRMIQEKSTPAALKDKALKAFQRVHPKIPATIMINCKPANAKVMVDGKEQGTCPEKIVHAPGAVAISIQAKGFKPWKTRLTVVPEENSRVIALLEKVPKPTKHTVIRGSTMPVKQRLRAVQPVMTAKEKTMKPARKTIPEKPAPIIKKRHSPWPWVLVGVGAAVAAGGGVMQGLAYKERMDVKNSASNGIITGYTQKEAAAKEDKARAYSISAYAMYGVGGAAVIGGIIWYILDKKHTTTTTAFFNGSSMAIGVSHAF